MTAEAAFNYFRGDVKKGRSFVEKLWISHLTGGKTHGPNHLLLAAA